ncbi:MAG: TadE/TadG family type IV pilus assembly protein [Streptosporangiaceae bacterium]
MTRGRVRRRLAAIHARLAGGGRDRGASAVELAILAPALIFASLLIVQFAIWFDARHAALAAAQQGDLVAREDASVNPGGWQGLAENAATSYYRGLNTSLISSVTAQASRGQNGMVSVTIKGRLTGIWPLTISETVTGSIECFRTQASQGVACG